MNIDFLRDDSRCCVVLYVLGVDDADHDRRQKQMESKGVETFDRHGRVRAQREREMSVKINVQRRVFL